MTEIDAPASKARREVLRRAGMAAATMAGVAALPVAASAEIGPQTTVQRGNLAHQIRDTATFFQLANGAIPHPDNGDEALYGNKIGSYSKALRHDRFGEVVPASYASMIAALSSGRQSDYERIKLGGVKKLSNPQAGMAFDLEGSDSHAFTMPPAPTVASAETAGEMVENYCMALARDVPFDKYDSDSTIAASIDALNALSDFKGPKNSAGKVSVETVFRGNTAGDLVGPLIS